MHVQQGCSATPPPAQSGIAASSTMLHMTTCPTDLGLLLQAYIVLDKPLEECNASKALLAGVDEYQETYGHFGDIHNPRIWSQPGDARCLAAASWVAFHTYMIPHTREGVFALRLGI